MLRAFARLATLALIAVTLAGCTDEPAEDWYRFEPVQCGGNPWDPQDGQVPGDEEEQAIRDFYEEQGLVLGEFAKKRIADAVPAVCGIMRGDRLYVTVSSGDAQVLLDDGWHVGAGPDEDPDVRPQE